MVVEAGWFELEETPWMERAACAGCDAGVFFPSKGISAELAKTICAGCTVRRDCLDYAVRWKIQFGIWGGLAVRERRGHETTQPRRRLKAAHETVTRYARGCRCQGCRDANYAASLWYEDDNAAL